MMACDGLAAILGAGATTGSISRPRTLKDKNVGDPIAGVIVVILNFVIGFSGS